MRLVDSHCHLNMLDLSAYAGDLSKALQAATSEGVVHFLTVSVTLNDFPDLLKIANTYQNVSASMGLHPTEEVDAEPTEADLIALASHDKVVAVGETGLDYYRSTGDLSWQRERFRKHIRAAKSVKKPLIIHTRQAREDTIAILTEENAQDVGGVMHCFTEDDSMAKKALDLGFYISFSGIVTFKNAKEIQAVAKQIPLDRILIETDSPYLAPVPFRGRTNEPAYVKYVAEYLAELLGVDKQTFAEQTTENFFRLFEKAKNYV